MREMSPGSFGAIMDVSHVSEWIMWGDTQRGCVFVCEAACVMWNVNLSGANFTQCGWTFVNIKCFCVMWDALLCACQIAGATAG